MEWNCGPLVLYWICQNEYRKFPLNLICWRILNWNRKYFRGLTRSPEGFVWQNQFDQNISCGCPFNMKFPKLDFTKYIHKLKRVNWKSNHIEEKPLTYVLHCLKFSCSNYLWGPCTEVSKIMVLIRPFISKVMFFSTEFFLLFTYNSKPYIL